MIRSASPWSRVKWNAHPGPARLSARSGLTGIEDTMLRYMPSVAGAIYVKREGEIPGLPGAAGSASAEAVWVNGINGLASVCGIWDVYP